MGNSVTSFAGQSTTTRSKLEEMKGELPHSFREMERLKVRIDEERSGPASRCAVVLYGSTVFETSRAHRGGCKIRPP